MRCVIGECRQWEPSRLSGLYRERPLWTEHFGTKMLTLDAESRYLKP